MPPATKNLQLEIAKHFELAHQIKNVRFVVELDDNDFWESYREEDPNLLPPRVHQMSVLPAAFDVRRLQSSDTRKFNALATAHGFVYVRGCHAWNDRIYFYEKQRTSDAYGQELVATWLLERPFRSLPKFDDLTPPELVDAAKVFMRFVKLHDGMLDIPAIEKVGAILKPLLTGVVLRLSKADAEFMELMSYITTVFLLEGV